VHCGSFENAFEPREVIRHLPEARGPGDCDEAGAHLFIDSADWNAVCLEKRTWFYSNKRNSGNASVRFAQCSPANHDNEADDDSQIKNLGVIAFVAGALTMQLPITLAAQERKDAVPVSAGRDSPSTCQIFGQIFGASPLAGEMLVKFPPKDRDAAV